MHTLSGCSFSYCSSYGAVDGAVTSAAVAFSVAADDAATAAAAAAAVATVTAASAAAIVAAAAAVVASTAEATPTAPWVVITPIFYYAASTSLACGTSCASGECYWSGLRK